jgi:hypothetical protein
LRHLTATNNSNSLFPVGRNWDELDVSGIGDLNKCHYRCRIRNGVKLENVTASIDYTNFSLVENTSWEYLNNLSRRVIIWSLSVAQERENIECKKKK